MERAHAGLLDPDGYEGPHEAALVEGLSLNCRSLWGQAVGVIGPSRTYSQGGASSKKAKLSDTNPDTKRGDYGERDARGEHSNSPKLLG